MIIINDNNDNKHSHNIDTWGMIAGKIIDQRHNGFHMFSPRGPSRWWSPSQSGCTTSLSSWQMRWPIMPAAQDGKGRKMVGYQISLEKMMDNCDLSHFHHGMLKAWQFMTMIEYSQTWMVKDNITLDIFYLFFPSLGIWDKSQLSNIGFIPIMAYSWLVVWTIFYFSICWE